MVKRAGLLVYSVGNGFVLCAGVSIEGTDGQR